MVISNPTRKMDPKVRLKDITYVWLTQYLENSVIHLSEKEIDGHLPDCLSKPVYFFPKLL